MKRHQIEGKEDLSRDPFSRAVVNHNKTQYQTYIESRKRLSSEKERVDALEDRMDQIKDDINDIKSLLLKLSNGQ